MLFVYVVERKKRLWSLVYDPLLFFIYFPRCKLLRRMWLYSKQNLYVALLIHYNLFRKLDGLLNCWVHFLIKEYRELWSFQKILGLLSSVAFDSHYNRLINIPLFNLIKHSLNHIIAAHNSSKYINEYCFCLLVVVNDLKSSLNILLVRSTTYIQKVCWLLSHEINKIHSGHCKTRTIDHAADYSIKFHIVQIILLCLYFQLIFLWQILLVEQILLKELCIVIDFNFGITDSQIIFLS